MHSVNARAPAPGRWRLGAAVGGLGAEATAACLSPTLGAALAAADIIVPLVATLVLLGAVLLGSTETCNRVFRLLRWIASRPEPPPPPAPTR